MNSNKKGSLYFIAVLPQEEVQKEVQLIKLYITEKYGSKAALKSPAHITLYMPFRWEIKKEDLLIDVLEKISENHKPFKLQLENFDAFKPRVIFIASQPSAQLEELHKSVVKGFKLHLNLFDKGFEERAFHPHMTVAFRDLKKPMFFKAWNEEFKEKSYSRLVEINELSLLKHNGQRWEVHKAFPLEG